MQMGFQLIHTVTKTHTWVESMIIHQCKLILDLKPENWQQTVLSQFDVNLYDIINCNNLIYANFAVKDRVQCFSMKRVMKNCFLLNHEKILVQIRLVIFKKNAKTA